MLKSAWREYMSGWPSGLRRQTQEILHCISVNECSGLHLEAWVRIPLLTNFFVQVQRSFFCTFLWGLIWSTDEVLSFEFQTRNHFRENDFNEYKHSSISRWEKGFFISRISAEVSMMDVLTEKKISFRKFSNIFIFSWCYFHAFFVPGPIFSETFLLQLHKNFLTFSIFWVKKIFWPVTDF